MLAKRLKVVALRNDDRETEKLFKALQEQVLLTCAWNLAELDLLLQGDSYDLFLCAASFPGGTWREALNQVQQSYPRLRVLVFASREKDNDWAGAIEAGAADVLFPGVREKALMAALENLTIRKIRRAS